MNASAEPVRCAVYLRVSLDETGEQLAVQRQREDCQRIARERGWRIVAEYVDNSVSAFNSGKKRPGYDRMVAAYRAGEFDALVCWDLDRLTRQPRQLEDWIEAATDRGLLLVTANGEADLSGDAGRLFVRIKASVARAEVERKAARQRRAALQRSERGRPPLGARLTGYTTKGEIVEAEAATVRALFERFAAGDSLRSLAAWLTESKQPTRSGARSWNPSSIRSILTNPRYAGRAIYQGKENGKLGTWEPVVTDDVFTVVQSRLADPRRKTNKVGTDRRHLGSSLFVCGPCGERVTSWSGNRYHCPRGCLTRAQASIDALVVALIRRRLAMPDLATLLVVDESPEVKAVNVEVKALRGRLIRIADDYDAGVIDGQRFKVATEKTRALLSVAEATQARLSAGSALSALLLAADPVEAFDRAPLMIRRNVIDALCAVRLQSVIRGRRTFDPESVEITWKAHD